MSMSVNASSNALSYLQQLLQYGASGASGASAAASDPLLTLDQPPATTDGLTQSGAGTSPLWPGSMSSFEPGTLAALISLQGQSASGVVGQSPSDLFSQLDTDGDGQISKAEFEKALGTVGVDTQSADALFSKLDTNDDGSVSPSELSQARGHGHHHHMGGAGEAQGGGSQQDGLSSLLSGADITGATTQTATNADGSTTTTITYADGTSVSMTTPAAAQGSSSSGDGSSDGNANGSNTNTSNANNLIEELIKLQSQLVSQAASTLSTIA